MMHGFLLFVFCQKLLGKEENVASYVRHLEEPSRKGYIGWSGGAPARVILSEVPPRSHSSTPRAFRAEP